MKNYINLKDLINKVIKLYLFVILFSTSFYCREQSNTYKAELKTSLFLIANLKEKDYLSVKNSFGLDLKHVGLNDEILNFNIDKLSEVLNSHELGLIEFVEYPSTSPHKVEITINLKKKANKSQSNYRVVIKFEKYLELGKIYNFNFFEGTKQVF